MTVPLDRLYNFLDNKVNHDMVIYRWIPHGSRKIEDCTPLKKYSQDQKNSLPHVVCHDQEPLDMKETTLRLENYLNDRNPQILPWHFLNKLGWNIHSKYILLHSEKNSDQVVLFQNKHAIPVYYWCHYLIARDWFRHAHIDPVINQTAREVKQDFLIYNRAWAGTREYRLRFCEMLVQQDLVRNSKVSFAAQDPMHYTEHIFKNPRLQIGSCDLETHLPHNTATANMSADYQNQDYVTTGIEIVLETLFDDTRHHLTEKTLRPIACGHPFILVATAGSLTYLRDYGFRTFGDIIDESYDQEHDPVKRLELVVKEMLRLRNHKQKLKIYSALRKRAKFNQQRFFSKKFFDQIIDEYQTGMLHALDQMSQWADGKYLSERWHWARPDSKRRFYETYQHCLTFLHTHRGIHGS